jgi:hypothetical protein
LPYVIRYTPDVEAQRNALESDLRSQLTEIERLLSDHPYPRPNSRWIKAHGDGERVHYSFSDPDVALVLAYRIYESENPRDDGLVVIFGLDPSA